MDIQGKVTEAKESIDIKIKRYLGFYFICSLVDRVNGWLVHHRFKNYKRGNLLSHAKRELEFAGYDLNQKEDDPNKWICENLIELLGVFSSQGHSGFSAPYCVDMFSKLARFEPLTPLTGGDDEWLEVGHEIYQNVRCSTVFKEGKNGKAYWIDGKVFREPNGATYTSSESRVFIEFPWVKSDPEIIDAEED